MAAVTFLRTNHDCCDVDHLLLEGGEVKAVYDIDSFGDYLSIGKLLHLLLVQLKFPAGLALTDNVYSLTMT